MNTAAQTQVLESFYQAFARRDWRAMAACYHPEAVFRDEVFDLQGNRVAAMWRMLLESAQDFRVEASDISVNGEEGRAHCSAIYVFPATGRRVRNEINSRFRFRDGLILRQRDAFSFWRWAGQALGPAGFLLGWLPRFQQVVQAKARNNLIAFIEKHPEAGP